MSTIKADIKTEKLPLPSQSMDQGIRSHWKSVMILVLLLLSFILIQSLIPLRTAIQIGGDEGFELAKATLCLKGYKLYDQVWNDQPPLHTFLVTQTLHYLSPSILAARLITTVFVLTLLTSLFLICQRLHGLRTAALATILLMASPGFLSLGSSCMLEMPAVATAVAGLCLLIYFPNRAIGIAGAGILFGLAMQIKLVSIVLMPIVGYLVCVTEQAYLSKRSIQKVLILGASLLLSFVAVDWLIDGGAYLSHFQQSWSSHFSPAKSFEYGSPGNHPFDWRILFRNWDMTLPAAISCVLLFSTRKAVPRILPFAWLALMLLAFGLHKPWWSYYYLHIAVPLSWCAAIGMEQLWLQQSLSVKIISIIFLIGAGCWMSGRLILQVKNIQNSPQTYTSPVFTEIERFKPFTQWVYCEDPVYSFHADIPMPPNLAVVMFKRLWSGEMTSAKIASELKAIEPGLILTANDTRMRPYQDLLKTNYRLVYEDDSLRLYAHKSIATKAPL